MTTNEIMALLAKPGIVAEMLIISGGGISYQAHVDKYTVHFNIEIEQLGTDLYYKKMETWRLINYVAQILPCPKD